MKTVIKAQRALSSGNKILIYNKDRSLFQELASEGQALSVAMGDRHKCYFEVRIDDDGLMHIGREVKANW